MDAKFYFNNVAAIRVEVFIEDNGINCLLLTKKRVTVLATLFYCC